MRRAAVGVLALVLAFGSACQDRHTWRGPEAEQVAWWIEDLAHGAHRRVGEIQLVDQSEMEARVATWAQGSSTPQAHRWPALLEARIQRQPLLAACAQQGLIVHTKDGWLAPRPKLDPLQRATVDDLVDHENLDRRQLDATVLALADANPDAATAYLAAARAARTALDEAMGAPAWSGKVTDVLPRPRP